MLDPADLINPRSAVSGSTDIEIRDSDASVPQAVGSSPTRLRDLDRRQARTTGRSSSPRSRYKWLDEGLQDRGITRDLEWGVPVPDDIADGHS